MATATAPAYEEIAFTDTLTAWSATVDGISDWWAGALRRRATPWQLADETVRWWTEMAGRRRPTWSTPHTVEWETPIARLRNFSTGDTGGDTVPTLVLPPQAGHDSCIVDYSPTQSQMATILSSGLTRAYSLDWVGATAATRRSGISDYLQVIGAAIDTTGGPVNLIGDCQGGWLATIYTALHPDRVNTLTIAGAPVDFHAGTPVIGTAMRAFAPGGDLTFYRALVAAGGGMLDGRCQLAGFVAMQPDNEVARQLSLLANINDETHVARYREFEDWFKHTQPISGDFYLWIVEQLFRDNKLVSGDLQIGSQRVDLGRITCPVNLLAGATDHITPAPQVFALADHVSTPKAAVLQDVTDGGHLGLFMGHDALSHHWPRLLAAVRDRSR